jgi:putative hemolysin
MPGDPFHFETPPGTPLRRAALTAARPFLSWALDLRTFRVLYEQLPENSSDTFAQHALRILNIDANCSTEELTHVPRQGPLIVAANHPHGALDGLLLVALLRHVRSDLRLLANYWLARIPELRASCFFVDPFEGPTCAARSRVGLRAAHLWLKHGGALVFFPAGMVAHDRRPDGSAIDPPWKETVGRMALRTGARVVPAHIAGSNSNWFYWAGRLHPNLRTLFLARELLKQRGQRVTVRFGEPFSPQGCAGVRDHAESVTNRARFEMERLGGRSSQPRPTQVGDAVAAELSQLDRACCLVENGPFQVFCAEARQIPTTLHELGRLREITYRAVGEGTGQTLDLDCFDEHYLHLFSWDRRERRLVGAYRIGRTDTIVASQGVEGLYTRRLFRYDRQFVDRFSPALELGRSFVRAEYQRNHNALFLLWKGVGRFVTEHPSYRFLFGPVSISSRYTDGSHTLLIAFLEQNHLERSLAELVEAIHPRQTRPVQPGTASVTLPTTIDEADKLVARLEADGKGIPVLLRQYLKLNARLIAVSIDPNFGDALDALMIVDLATVHPAILSRYLGREQAESFLARHRPAFSPQAA